LREYFERQSTAVCPGVLLLQPVTAAVKKIILHIVLLGCFSVCQSQPASVFETITTANGLPSNYIFCVEEDSEGFTWVGTDKGLCRYNGAIWEVWDIDKGLPGNYVLDVKSDRHNGLWLSVSEKGLYHFDCNSKKTVKINVPGNITGLVTNAAGSLTFETISNRTKTVAYWTCPAAPLSAPKKTKELPLPAAQHAFIYDDTLTKKTHFFIFNNVPAANAQFAAYKTIIKHYFGFDYGIEAEESVTITSRFIISNDWLIRFSENGDADTVIRQPFFKIKKGPITATENYGSTWFGKNGGGFYHIDNRTLQITPYTEAQGLTSMNVNQLHKKRDGSVYAATLGGGINVLQPNASHHYSPRQLPVNFLQISNGRYYGIANGYLYIFDPQQMLAEIFVRPDMLCFYVSNDTLMAGSFEGLHYYSIQNNKATLLSTLPLSAGISTILPWSSQWLCSTYGSGFFTTADMKTKSAFFNREEFPFGNIEKTVLLKNKIAALSFENGFFTCSNSFENIEKYSMQNGLLSNYISTVFEQTDTLWAGGKKGVSLIVNGRVARTLSYAEGFKGRVVKHIFSVPGGFIWVVSDQYIHSYIKGSLRAIGSSLLTTAKDDHIIAAAYDPGLHNLIAATQKGLSVRWLFSVRPNNETSKPLLGAVKVDNMSVDPNSRFTVAYNRNNLFFQFKPLDNLLFSRTGLYYRLNSNEWAAVTDSLTVSFNRLRPGSYQLWAKTINADGFESPPEIVASFTVNKPWWQQGWFIALVALTLLAGIYQLTRFINKRRFQKKLQELRLQQELETERQRISRDLHDNMGAYTSALIANVQQLKNRTGDTDEVIKMQHNAEEILSSLRETIWVLNNKEVTVQEFSDSFKNYCFKVLKNFEQIGFEATEQIENNIQLSAPAAIHLNKILQEAIQNIIKHAGATGIHYTIACGNELSITIADNGNGAGEAAGKKGNGLENMQWRANEAGAIVTIEFVRDKGTTVRLTKG
jgi:signal transduction histidine kinase